MPLRRYQASIDFFGPSQDPMKHGFMGRQCLFSRKMALPGTFANATNALKAAAQKVGAPPSGCDEIKLSVEVSAS